MLVFRQDLVFHFVPFLLPFISTYPCFQLLMISLFLRVYYFTLPTFVMSEIHLNKLAYCLLLNWLIFNFFSFSHLNPGSSAFLMRQLGDQLIYYLHSPPSKLSWTPYMMAYPKHSASFLKVQILVKMYLSILQRWSI